MCPSCTWWDSWHVGTSLQSTDEKDETRHSATANGSEQSSPLWSLRGPTDEGLDFFRTDVWVEKLGIFLEPVYEPILILCVWLDFKNRKSLFMVANDVKQINQLLLKTCAHYAVLHSYILSKPLVLLWSSWGADLSTMVVWLLPVLSYEECTCWF